MIHKIADTETGARCACGWKCEGLMFPRQARVFAAEHLYATTFTAGKDTTKPTAPAGQVIEPVGPGW